MGVAALGEDLAITSFPGNGTLSWAYPTNDVTSYRVEWASQADGPWADTWDNLRGIAPTGATMVAAVPMFYRVVVAVTNPPVPVPAGTNAGTDPDFGVYSLTVDSFEMDKYEVSKGLWDEVYSWAITNGYGFDNAGSVKAANHPVQRVNWYDCVKWCNARSQRAGRPAVYTVDGAVYKTGQADNVVQTAAAGYRLPTDVEWEYAARGGSASRRFPWGDSIQHARANYLSISAYSYDTSPTRSHHPAYNDGTMPYTGPIGSFAANGYGLRDMVGNVLEWCFDWHPSYMGTNRVVRGGSWGNGATYCRVGDRDFGGPAYANYARGFRTVLSPGP